MGAGNMKILVGYNGGEVGERALILARDYALATHASVVVMTSMQGGKGETEEDIQKAARGLEQARKILEDAGLKCDVAQSVRGLSPGEDIVKYARDKEMDHIFLGIKKKSRTEKMLLGSTSRFVILKAHCPVTTIK
jgi:nucleotide-binding universal stress UspA family protein